MKCHKIIWEESIRAPDRGGELLKSFRGHLCWVYWENPLWPWLWPVKALCAHFQHLITAQIMPTTATCKRVKLWTINVHRSAIKEFSKCFHESRRADAPTCGIPDHFHLLLGQKSLSSSLLQPSRFPIKDNNSTGNEEEPKVLWLLKREETPEKY